VVFADHITAPLRFPRRFLLHAETKRPEGESPKAALHESFDAFELFPEHRHVQHNRAHSKGYRAIITPRSARTTKRFDRNVAFRRPRGPV
jgi:hypothetical protein